MDGVFLSRIQFGITIALHYIFPLFSIGLAWFVVLLLSLYLKTKHEIYISSARFWIKILGIFFVGGVVTGITMEFQFGTNWALFATFMGDAIGAPLALEALFAFFIESIFLGVLLFGEKRISQKQYLFAAVMVAVGTLLSAFWIIVANSLQQTPAGVEVVDGVIRMRDFSAAVFNPSTVPRFLHAVTGSFSVASLFVMAVCAYYLLKGKFSVFVERNYKLALVMAFISAVAQLPIGHFHAVQVAKTQPVKLAAFEGLFDSGTSAPLLLFGIPDPKNAETKYALRLPSVLSIAIGGSTDTYVKGLKDFPRSEWPPIIPVFLSFHLMAGIGFYLIAFTIFGIYLLWKRSLLTSRYFGVLSILSAPLPLIANELGWFGAEVGRQPWIVQGLMKTVDANSKVVPPEQILFSIIAFSIVYSLLVGLCFFLIKNKIDHGPLVSLGVDAK